MAANPIGEVMENLRNSMLLREGAGWSDPQLLAEFFNRHDEAALASLVKRHAPMVWGVCRRVLCNHHDVEEAFQATFLVFVRKAASIRNKELLGNWLYGVARRTALKARSTTARRKQHEKQVIDMPEPAEIQEKLVNDLQPLLDQELGLLPEKYRVVIVLCELEGKTRQEAARFLGCPEGTVASRLARGRNMLAKRLARHGLPVPGGVLAVLLAHRTASASIPSSVVLSTIGAAKFFALGQATDAIPLKVVALAEGVLKMMLLKKLANVAFAFVLASLLGLAASAWVMARTETETDARPENAAAPRKLDQGGQKDEKDMGKKALADDLRILDGTWRLVALEIGGNPVDPETWGRNVRRVFSGTAVHLHSGTRVTRSEISIDPSKTPKWMDETWVTGARTHGIYELKGNTLRLFMVPAEEQRPANFKTRKGTQEAIATFERDHAAVEKDGLSVRLEGMQRTFMEGEDLRFSGTVENAGDKDFRIYPHPSWHLGWEVTIEDGPWQVVSLLKDKRKPPVLLLKAGQKQGIGMTIGDNSFYRWSGPQTEPVPPRDHLEPGKYRLRAVMKFIENETPGPPFWTGTIKTPPVAFEIVADPIPARLRQVEWGKETDGLVAKFRAVKAVAEPGEPLEFEVLVKNVSEKDIRFLGENGRLSPLAWRFHFGDWEWSSPIRPTAMRLKPGETAAARCLVATTMDSLSAERKRHAFAGPFHNVRTGEKSTRLPEGVHRVRAETFGKTFGSGKVVTVETNVIEVRIASAEPLPPETARTWKDAGVAVGWVRLDRSAAVHFNTAKKEQGDEIPGFQLEKWRDGMLNRLPDPGIPFGLDLSGTQVTDAGLKELAGLKSLQMLNLGVTQVTDVGLKELAGLKVLQSLDLGSTQVTDAGLKELARMQGLQSLKLFKTRVTDAGLKELAGLQSLRTLNLFDARVTNAGLKDLAGLVSLQSLELGGTQVTDAGLKELAVLKGLQSLSLQSTQVTGAGLKELAGLKSLRTLNLFHSKLTNAGLKELAGMQSLRELYLGATQVTDAGLMELTGMKNLQVLNLFNTRVTDAGLKRLAGLKNLETPSLWGTQVTDAGLEELAGLNLKLLYLANTQVTDVGMKELAGMNDLQALILYNTRVTDAGLMELAGLKNLRTLNLQETQVTARGVTELQRALPECRIDR